MVVVKDEVRRVYRLSVESQQSRHYCQNSSFKKVMSRQQLRKTRLLQLEREQRLEDEEGLLMTEVITSGYLNNSILMMIYRNNVNLSLIHLCLSSLNFMT